MKEEEYFVFTIEGGYVKFRSNTGFSGSSPIKKKTAQEEINELVEDFELKPHQYEII